MQRSGSKILALHPNAELYGSDRMFLLGVRQLANAGSEVTVILPENGPLSVELRHNRVTVRIRSFPAVRKRELSPRRFLGWASRMLGGLITACRLIHELKPDAIYINTVIVPQWIIAARLMRRPVLVQVHELGDELGSFKAKILYLPLLAANSVVCVSRAVSQSVLGLHPRLKPKLRVIMNGIAMPIDPFQPAEFNATRALMVVGRLSPIKGQDLAIAATKSLVTEGWDVKLHLYGTVFPGYEWFEQKLKEQVRREGLNTRVFFHGFKDAWEGYRSADIALVPSRSDSLPLVAIEAMAAGRVQVVSDAGGIPEIVTDGETGWVCRRNDADDLAEKIRRCLNNPSLARRMGAQAAVDARARFTLARYTAEFASAVAELIAH